MGIPVGWNIVRDEASAKDVLRADLTGRSPIRRHARTRNRRADGRSRRSPELTPGFAPAHARERSADADADADEVETVDLRLLRRFPTPHARDEAADEPASAAGAVAHPPLRRVGHRQLPASSLRESWSPVSALDGLGDRERSNSVSSTASHLPWATFLTTVVPDPVAPTAESSFASSAASASFAASSSRASSSNSHSAASEHTLLTVPSRRASPARRQEPPDSFARACESSDEDDADDADDTDDDDAAPPLARRRMRPSHFADAPPTPRAYGRSLLDTTSDARRYVRSFYSHGDLPGAREAHADAPVDGPLDGPLDPLDGPVGPRDLRDPADSFATVDDDAPSTSPASPLDQELRDARSLLERLTRRGDIGDDFWASVGLTRSFSDGIDRVHDRGRF